MLGKSWKNTCRAGDAGVAYHLKKLEQRIRQNGISKRLCDVYEAGTIMAQCGLRHRMERQIRAVQNGQVGSHDDIDEAERCFTRRTSVLFN